MYKKVKLTGISEIREEFNEGCLNYYYKIGESKYLEKKGNTKIAVSKFVDSLFENPTELDAKKISDAYFPNNEIFNVFLCHSYKNIADVLPLAGFLEDNGLKVFIDSLLWESKDHINNILNKKYSKINQSSNRTHHNLKKVLIISTVVDNILSMALSTAIDRIECFMLVDTTNTLSINLDQTSTRSPWIFHEIQISNLIKNRVLQRNIYSVNELKIFSESLKLPSFKFEVDITGFKDGTLNKLIELANRGYEKTDLLDQIYDSTNGNTNG